MSIDRIKLQIRTQAEIAHRAVREIEHIATQHHSADIDLEAVRELSDVAQSATSYRDLLAQRRKAVA